MSYHSELTNLTRTVSFRVSREDFAKIQARAKEAGLETVRRYAKALVLTAVGDQSASLAAVDKESALVRPIESSRAR